MISKIYTKRHDRGDSANLLIQRGNIGSDRKVPAVVLGHLLYQLIDSIRFRKFRGFEPRTPIQPSAGGHGGTFIPEGIRWVVERSLAWVSRYRRLNTIFERTEGHLVAFIEIAFISILSRRLGRLVTQQISA
jgi:hypothetical protein